MSTKNYMHDDSDAPLLTSRGDLLRQYVVIGSGRLPNICPGIEARAAEIAEEVLDLARAGGHPPFSAPACTAQAAFAFFDWLDAACVVVGAEVVDEIFNRPKHRSLQ
jgi:hypothetical protein